MKCPRCDGEGTIDIYPGGGFALNPGNRPIDTKQCPICRGVGNIPGPSEEEVTTEKNEQS